MSAGAGAMAYASACMRQVQRDLNAHLRMKKAWRRARFDPRHRMRIEKVQPQTAEFPCFALCSECGYISREATACPACGTENWYDLTLEATAYQVRDMEELQRNSSPRWVKAIVVALVVLAATGVVAATWLNCWIALLSVALTIPIYAVLLRPATVFLLRYAKGWPARWRFPMPLPAPGAKPSRTIQGKVKAQKEPLRAPFSGKECVAYQVSILFDVAGDARPPEWVLQETEGADLDVEGVPVKGDLVHLAMASTPIETASFEQAGLDLTKFMRERGLFAYDGDFEFFEACVVEGTDVQIALHSDTDVATLTPVS